jgi:predicted MFS family arabinose efflux permease
MGLALALFTATEIFWFGCLTSAVLGVTFIIMSVGNQTLIQAAVDPDLRGRVVAVYGMTAQDVPALGAMIMGGFAEHLGLQLPVAVGAGICLILWLWGRRQQGWMTAVLETETPKTRSARQG